MDGLNEQLARHTIKGQLVTLRPATLANRRAVYEWAALSDATPAMMGPPLFPDNPVPTWEEFCEDHKPYFFDGSAPHLGRCFLIVVDGEPVGQIYYNDIQVFEGKKRTELDMWMRAERYCGRGYGSDALDTLCAYLAAEFGVQEFMVQPSARNPRAIRAYEKIGFQALPSPLGDGWAAWPGDYHDSVFMVKAIPLAERAGRLEHAGR
jgi:diamine N-acetyltransferase